MKKLKFHGLFTEPNKIRDLFSPLHAAASSKSEKLGGGGGIIFLEKDLTSESLYAKTRV